LRPIDQKIQRNVGSINKIQREIDEIEKNIKKIDDQLKGVLRKIDKDGEKDGKKKKN
jgi:t-SNARE complex subunit (syntaxin)